MINTLTNIFVYIHNYCKLNDEKNKKTLKEDHQKNLNRKHKMHLSEVMTIIIAFPLSGYKDFKSYFIFIETYHKNEFKNLCSYTNFIEYKNTIKFIIEDFLRSCCLKKSSIRSIIDSFSIKACHNIRRNMYVTLKSIAGNGKGTMGYFTGFKLFIIIDLDGNIIAFHIVAGNISDNDIKELLKLCKNANTQFIYGDRGFLLSSSNKDKMTIINKKIITRNRKNMKKAELTEEDEQILNQRHLIETIGNILKNKLGLEHTRHRSIAGFFTHIFSVLIAYCFDKQNNETINAFESNNNYSFL